MPLKSTKRKHNTNCEDSNELPASKRAAPAPACKLTAKAKEIYQTRQHLMSGSNTRSKQRGEAATKGRGTALEAKMEIRKKTQEIITLINDTENNEGPDLDARRAVERAAGGLAAFDPQTPPGQDQGIYQDALDCLRGLQKLVKSYEGMSKQESGIDKPTWMRWQQDSKDMRELNKRSMTIAKRMINDMISPSLQAGDMKAPEDVGEIEAVARDLMEDVKCNAGQQTWASMAQAIVYGVSGIFEAMPCGKIIELGRQKS